MRIISRILTSGDVDRLRANRLSLGVLGRGGEKVSQKPLETENLPEFKFVL